MSSFLSASHAEIFTLLGVISRQLSDTSCFEVAAQRCLNLFYEQYESELALARLYVTSTFSALPAENRQFVEKLARSKEVGLRPDVPVLSLIGTRGRRPSWNDRRQSKGHLGIPLVSPDFVTALPMIARMFSDFEIELAWIERPERGISTTRSGWSGLFHVADARDSQDQHQRYIIPARDFVAEEEVRTGFGIGGSFISGTLLAMIFFTRCVLSRELAQRYLPLGTMFKTATSAHIEAGRIFA